METSDRPDRDLTPQHSPTGRPLVVVAWRICYAACFAYVALCVVYRLFPEWFEAIELPVVPPRVATWGLDVLSLYVAADAYEGWIMGRIFEDGSGRPTEEVAQEYFQQFAERLAALPAKQYPAITANLTSLMSGGGDERFAFGVDTLIAGMAAQVPDEGADRADG